MQENKRRALERGLWAVLILSLLALAVLTPLWWMQEHPRAEAAPVPTLTPTPTPAPTPSPTPGPDIRYREAEDAARAGQFAAALEAWEALGDYADSTARAEECREAMYASAWDCLLRRELDEAASLLRPLGDYRDSLRWLRYCERHRDEDASAESLIEAAWVFYEPKHRQGVLYAGTMGLFYLPNLRGPETQTLLYFPGGSDLGLHRLDTNAVIEYVNAYAPDALCVFAYESGFHVLEEHNRACWDYVEGLLRECALVPHEIVLVGTSNGFYAAEKLALQLWDEEGLPVRAVLSLDAGEDWGVTEKLLDGEQLARLAEAGTRLELFEQRRFRTDREPIRALLDAGLAVDLIECDNGDHDTITRYAFRLGVFSWALGECELNARQYTLTELK